MPIHPNVVFIYADDLGRGMLSCYGQRHFRTPNIDRIAGEGVLFSNVYHCSFCAPSRASLLTGLHDCHRNGYTFTSGGIYNRLTSGRLSLDELSELINAAGLQDCEDEVFLAQVARQAGYVTAQIGKLEWGFASTDWQIRRHGWDYHYGYYDHAQCHGFYPPYLFENGRQIPIAGNTRDDFGKMPSGETPENREKRQDLTGCAVYSQDLFDQKILQFLRENRDRRFFLYHPSQLPHGPISIREIHPSVKDNPHLTQYEKEYASMVLRLDQTVGLVLDELKRLGIDDRTAVVFCADNGHAVYYRQDGRCDPSRDLRTGQSYDNVTTRFTTEASGDVFNGNDGMAGLKFSNWEGGVRIPYMVRWPGVVKPGRVSSHFMAGYDFLPTLAEMVGSGIPDGKDGISFLPELQGDTGRQGQHDHVLFASGLGPAMVTPDGWKLRHIRLPKQNLYQLYHLPEDPREEKDLVHEAADVTRRLSAQMLRACEGNYMHGICEYHRAYIPGLHFYGPECHWDMLD